MLTAASLRAGAAATGLVVSGGLAIAAAVTVATAPLTPRLAIAQPAAAVAAHDGPRAASPRLPNPSPTD